MYSPPPPPTALRLLYQLHHLTHSQIQPHPLYQPNPSAQIPHVVPSPPPPITHNTVNTEHTAIERSYDVIIVGAGPSGLSTAIRIKQISGTI